MVLRVVSTVVLRMVSTVASRVVLESGLESGLENGVKLVLVYTAGSECFEPQKLNPIFGNAIK